MGNTHDNREIDIEGTPYHRVSSRPGAFVAAKVSPAGHGGRGRVDALNALCSSVAMRSARPSSDASAHRLLLLGAFLASVACTPPVEPPHFLWSSDAQSLDNPFPDERSLASGKLALRPRWYQPFLPRAAQTAAATAYFKAVAAQAEREVSAVGAFGATLLLASEPLEAASLEGTAARLVRGDDGTWSVLERTVSVEHARAALEARGVPFPEDFPHFAFVRPAVPLPEGREGLLVMLRGARTSAGAALGRGAEWNTNQAGLAKAAAATLEVPEADVLLVLPQRAGEVSAVLRSLSAWATANPPAVTFPSKAVVSDGTGARPVGRWAATDADWNTLSPYLATHGFSRPPTHVGRVLLGELAARDLRERGVFKAEWLGDPSSAPVVPLRFVMTVPTGLEPAGGWPMVMTQHGVGGRNTPREGDSTSFCLNLAEALAARGLGCIGVDAPDHGSRGAFTNFFGVDDLPALRDRFRQMTFDLLQVEAAVVTIDVDGDGTPDVNPKVRYFGNSLGSIMGASFLPMSNRVSTAMLNVPGAGLSNLITSPNLQDLIGLQIAAQTGVGFDTPEYLASFPLFRAIAQPFFDPGDPINTARGVRPEVAVLVQAGRGDRIIPLQTSVDLARAMGLPDQAEGVTRRAFTIVDPARYLPAAEVSRYNGHNVMWDFEPVREQALRFLASDGAELTTP